MPDGHLNQCKSCVKARKAEYYINNKDKVDAKCKGRYVSRREEYLTNMKEYYNLNKDTIIEQHKEYVHANLDKVKAYHRKYRIDHWEELNIKANIRWKRRRARKLDVKENYTLDDRLYTLELFDNSCVNCGSKYKLCIDHHKPLSRGYALTRENAVVLCRSCNCSKWKKMPEEFYSPDILEVIESKLHPHP